MGILIGEMGRENEDELLRLHFEDRLFHIPSLIYPDVQQPITFRFQSAKQTNQVLPPFIFTLFPDSLSFSHPLPHAFSHLLFPLCIQHHQFIYPFIYLLLTYTFITASSASFTLADAPVPILPPPAPNSIHQLLP